ncbi:MAG TPA: trehalose-6-phosphate synthase [Kofleriaceae bacterium]|nr:trehalose-6-phosphate synthase [Kofleriaceae bacterium]
MPRTLRFLVVLVVGLLGLTFIGYIGLVSTTRSWFDKDMALRAQLAVESAHGALLRNWGPDRRAILESTLEDVTRDERIMGAAACSLDGETLVQTDAFPPGLGCAGGLAYLGAAPSWSTVQSLPSGPVRVSVHRLADGDHAVGAIVLVQDLSFIARREQTTRRLVFGAFAILAVGAALMTLFALRVAWRRWTADLRQALAGRAAPEFRPLVRDVRELVDRLVQEREGEGEGRAGPWSPTRLRATLARHLGGEKIVVLANREPYIHERRGERIQVQHPASGLVTALEPVMRACSGVWVAHGSGSADRETVDAHDRVAVPPGERSYQIRRVWMTEEEEQGYYYGFANEGLWPLCHVADTRPTFRASDWDHYVTVNRRFADAVCTEIEGEDPIILVQDYHFALAPRMIRERLPRATIITFWHIPWPNAERFGICPWREELIAGLLGSSIVGFHTQQHCNHFFDAVDAYMESRIDREHSAVVQAGQRTLVRPYPISIEWPVHWLDEVPPVAACRALVRAELGLAPDALLGVGVDRLDYTKGIEERLRAVDELLERYPEFRGRFTFVQLAAPSRTKIERYRELDERVEALADEINRRWSAGDYRPIAFLRAHHEPPRVFTFFRAAEVCYVSSLHDGMNLVAKEFGAARDDEQGVLVLSQFTGAARDLTEALTVNPYDLRTAADALAAALRMRPGEQRDRMRSMRRLVAEFNVYRWAGRMLVDAAEVRRRERMSGRLRRRAEAARG